MILSSAYADSCNDLEHNGAWNKAFQNLNDAYNNKDYDTALKYSRELEKICESSPKLNYTIAYIHKNKGDDEKYKFYLTKATQNTERFAVDKYLLDRIWTEKYIAENPEADPDTIKQREATIVSLTEENTQLKDQLKSSQLTAGEAVSLQDEVNSAHASDDAMLWTSVSFAAAGLVLTGVGAALVGMNNDKAIAGASDGQYVKGIYNTGWALIGSGIGVTIIGTALTGYFGYRYSKNHKDDNTKQISFTILPSYSSMTIAF